MKFKKTIASLISTAYVATAAPISTFAVKPESALSEQKKEEIVPESTEPPIAATQLGDEPQATANQSQSPPANVPADATSPATTDDETTSTELTIDERIESLLAALQKQKGDPSAKQQIRTFYDRLQQSQDLWHDSLFPSPRDADPAPALLFTGPSGTGMTCALPFDTFLDRVMNFHIRHNNVIDASNVHSVDELVSRIRSLESVRVTPITLVVSAKSDGYRTHFTIGTIPIQPNHSLDARQLAFENRRVLHDLATPSGYLTVTCPHDGRTVHDFTRDITGLLLSHTATIIYSRDNTRRCDNSEPSNDVDVIHACLIKNQ